MAIDRLGSGSSSRPPTDGVLADAGSEALQGVVKELSKAITTSGKVFAAGHSAGSSLIIRAAAAYGDLDGIVVTGFLHATGSGGGLYGPATQPAGDDPKFKGDVSVPTGYVTTRAGVRPLFYYPWNADEWVVEKDDLTKDATSGVDPGGVADERTNGTYAKQLKVPVLTIIGQRDLLFCTPPLCPEAQREASFYPLSPSVETIVRPRTGHSIALHDNAEATNDKLADWLDKKTRPYRPWDR